MKHRSNLIELIGRLRCSAGDPEEAYAQRMRLKRAILSSARLACEEREIEVPDRIAEVTESDVKGGGDSLLDTCKKLAVQSEELCQPSEALTVRWRNEWDEIVTLLGKLEAKLQNESTD